MALRISRNAHRIIRAILLLTIAGGIGYATHRFRRSEEQVELTRYVERDLPALTEEEHAIANELDQLMQARSLPPTAARKRLIEDLIPRLVRLRRRAESLVPKTVTVRQLAGQYLIVLDAWTEAARGAVRAIDDPQLSTEASFASVRERLTEAARAATSWRSLLVETCAHHHLASPGVR